MSDDFDIERLYRKTYNFMSRYGILVLVALGTLACLLLFWPDLYKNLWGVFIGPVIVVVVGLAIEYWIVQPLRNRRGGHSQLSRDWATAQEKAIEWIRSQRPNYEWEHGSESIKVESFQGSRGRGTLNLAILTERISLRGYHRHPALIERLKLTIDKSGDILEQESIPVEKPDTAGLPEMDEMLRDIFNLASTNKPRTELPDTTVTIKEVKEPTVNITSNSVVVRVEFVIENKGRAGKICPYVEFKVVDMQRGITSGEQKIRSKEDWVVEVDELSTYTLAREWTFAPAIVPLVKPPHKVKVELYPCPPVQAK
ncbi:MAG: hypothetical protein HYZ49_03020 [Chloroflexi bacterium]|nr:hypothetical protein [Chloroflexota bacterium]